MVWLRHAASLTKDGRREMREVTMILIPVVLVIGGFLALVYWLEKRSSPWPK
jgi:hypothetical protein